jgi:hypothetical protein
MDRRPLHKPNPPLPRKNLLAKEDAESMNRRVGEARGAFVAGRAGTVLSQE